MESFDTAIRCGADAVYLGFSSFNARMKAQNFDETNIKDVVSRAHFYGVKVYVALNTILQNQELKDLIDIVKVAVEAKVDAFLVQDLGVCKILKDCFEGIVLHASTQMGVHNLYGAKVAESMGISRVVLSRETKLDDIIEIKKNTSLEIEYFVQGALCIAFSGNCYLSSVEQNASGNRGLCKQLCRLPYDWRIGDNKGSGYMLSARDLCLAPTLEELARAGVDSFKIEGRLRRAGYVAEAVTTYRRLLDEVEKSLNDAKSKMRFSKSDEQNLKIAFSRGEYLNRAYLDKGTPHIVEKRYQNHTGIEIGKVLNVKPFKQDLFEVTLQLNREMTKGDGLKFFDKGKEVGSLGVGDVKKIGGDRYSFVTKQQVKPNWQVNLIASVKQDELAKNAERNLAIDMSVVANVGECLQIDATYKDLCFTKSSDTPLEVAKNAPMSEDDISKQVSKVGGSGFVTSKIDVQTNGVFIAKSMLNALRRDVLDELKAKIIDSNSLKTVIIRDDEIVKMLGIIDNASAQEGKILTVESGESIFSSKINGGNIILRPSSFTRSEIENMCAVLGVDESDVALELPIIANSHDLKVIGDLLSVSKINTLISNNIYGLYFAGDNYRVIAGQGHNVANVIAVRALKDLGASGYIPSLEYRHFDSDKTLNRYDVSENIPLMTFAHCPFKTIYGNECSKCSYKPNLTLQRNGKWYKVIRHRLSQCYFSLFPIEK